jgi:hypothetical protein
MSNLILSIPYELIRILIDSMGKYSNLADYIEFMMESMGAYELEVIFKDICFHNYPLVTAQLTKMIQDGVFLHNIDSPYFELYKILKNHYLDTYKLSINVNNVDYGARGCKVPDVFYSYAVYKKCPKIYKELIGLLLDTNRDLIKWNWDLLYHISINDLSKFGAFDGRLLYLFDKLGMPARKNWKQILTVLISDDSIKYAIRKNTPLYEMIELINSKSSKDIELFKFIYEKIGLNHHDMLIETIRTNNYKLFKWIFVQDGDKFKGDALFERKFNQLIEDKIPHLHKYICILNGYTKL